VKWFTKAAEQGYVNAQNNLGVMYDDGDAVAENDVEAVKWFTKAAEQGFARAQNNLGAMYENGRGVPKDTIQAAKWYILAIAQGNEEAVTKYTELAKLMTPEQIDQAQQASKQFVPQNANQ
jgi:TPR repeat protein